METEDGADSMEVLSSTPSDGEEKRKRNASSKKIFPKQKAKKAISWLEGSQTRNEEEGSKVQRRGKQHSISQGVKYGKGKENWGRR